MNYLQELVSQNGWELKVKRLDTRAIIPSKEEENSGYDLYPVFNEDYVLIPVGGNHLFNTGLAVQLPKGFGFVIANRSGNGSKGAVYGAHIVDSGYRGEVFLDVHNISGKTIIVSDLSYEEMKKREMEKIENSKNTVASLLSMVFPYIFPKKDDVIILLKSKALVQAMILPTFHFPVREVDELDESIRGEGSRGSSGK